MRLTGIRYGGILSYHDLIKVYIREVFRSSLFQTEISADRMKKVVTDSSVMVKWVSQDGELNLDKADQLLTDVQAGKVSLQAPELAKYEIGNALLKKGLSQTQAFQSLGTIYSLPIRFVAETEELANQTYQMANELRRGGDLKFTYYDASFAALAKQDGAILVTANPKHQAKIAGVKVISLENYQ